MVKIVAYIPVGYLDAVLDVLRSVGANRIGEYADCISWWRVRSTWTSLDGAHPFSGEVGEVSVEDEYRVEFSCDDDREGEVAAAIHRVHPYEEPVIEAYPIVML